MTAYNDITGDAIQSKLATEAYVSNHASIFTQKREQWFYHSSNGKVPCEVIGRTGADFIIKVGEESVTVPFSLLSKERL
jgi:hypothetical protein